MSDRSHRRAIKARRQMERALEMPPMSPEARRALRWTRSLVDKPYSKWTLDDLGPSGYEMGPGFRRMLELMMAVELSPIPRR